MMKIVNTGTINPHIFLTTCGIYSMKVLGKMWLMIILKVKQSSASDWHPAAFLGLKYATITLI